jgi:hypothetical protein
MTHFRYAISFGLAGCYLPDSQSGPYIGSRRKDLAFIIHNEIALADWPKSLFRTVRIKNLWKHITRHGSSTLHFSIHHKGYCITFTGLTEAECLEMEKDNF